MAMLTWIVVDVVDMSLEIIIIANKVLPVTALPNTALALALPTGRYAFVARQCPGEFGLDQAPAQREIEVAERKGAQGMQMIGQHDYGVDLPRMPSHGLSNAG